MENVALREKNIIALIPKDFNDLWATHRVLPKAIILIQVMATQKNSVYFLEEICLIPIVFHSCPVRLKSPGFQCSCCCALQNLEIRFGFLTACQTRQHQFQRSVCQALEANPHTRQQTEITTLNLRLIYQRSFSADQKPLL